MKNILFMPRGLFIVHCFFLFSTINNTIMAQTYTSIASGDFNDCGIWNQLSLDQSGDEIFVVSSGHTITIPPNTTIYGDRIQLADATAKVIMADATSSFNTNGSGSTTYCSLISFVYFDPANIEQRVSVTDQPFPYSGGSQSPEICISGLYGNPYIPDSPEGTINGNMISIRNGRNVNITNIVVHLNNYQLFSATGSSTPSCASDTRLYTLFSAGAAFSDNITYANINVLPNKNFSIINQASKSIMLDGTVITDGLGNLFTFDTDLEITFADGFRAKINLVF